MTNYDFNPYIYEEIEKYYKFLNDDRKFLDDLKKNLTKNDRSSKGILRSSPREV